jgi:hypothetical protein
MRAANPSTTSWRIGSMKTWEYMIVDTRDVAGRPTLKGKDRADVDRYLNTLGEQGWEIVNLDFRDPEHRYEFTGVAKREREA